MGLFFFEMSQLKHGIIACAQKKFHFFEKKVGVPNKMSEGGRYIIAEMQNPVKGRLYADQ